MIKQLTAICFRREIRLWGNHCTPRSWEFSERAVPDLDWHHWQFELDTDAHEIIAKRLAPAHNPIVGKVFRIPVDGENIDSYTILEPPRTPMVEVPVPAATPPRRSK